MMAACAKARIVSVCLMVIAVFQLLWFIAIWNISIDSTESMCADKIPNCGQQTKEELSPTSECFLFVMILSTADSRARRDTIRDTWMSDHRSLVPRVVVKFIIGTLSLPPKDLQSLVEEQKQFNDLILLKDLKDSFNNLTRKVLSSFVHIDKSYSYSYLFKGDDDTFVRLDVLVSELSERMVHSKYYWGFFDGRSKPKLQGRYKETDWFVCDLYVPYALGGGYILSHDLVSRITANADGLKLYNAEDISVGLWLSGFDIERKHDVRFDTEYKSRGCQNVYLVSHKQTRASMIEKYNNIRTNGKQCTEEVQVRGSYHYNWGVPPSQCCKREKGIP